MTGKETMPRSMKKTDRFGRKVQKKKTKRIDLEAEKIVMELEGMGVLGRENDESETMEDNKMALPLFFFFLKWQAFGGAVDGEREETLGRREILWKIRPPHDPSHVALQTLLHQVLDRFFLLAHSLVGVRLGRDGRALRRRYRRDAGAANFFQRPFPFVGGQGLQ